MENKVYEDWMKVFFKRIKNCRMLVVGDVMLDQYLYGEVSRISPEAPVPVTHIERQVSVPGGAANVAYNLARLGCQTYLAGVVGKDSRCEILKDLLQEAGIGFDGLIQMRRDTIAKIRVIGCQQQMLRLDFEETAPMSENMENELLMYIQQVLSDGIDGILLSDYKKGVCTNHLCQLAISYAHCTDVPIFVDPKQRNWELYAGADYITPNLKELGEAVGRRLNNTDDAVVDAARCLAKKYDIRHIVATRSERGLSIFSQDQVCHIPTTARDVFDVSGAGDTVIAVLAAAVAGNLPLDAAAYLANLAAGISVGKVGTYAVSAMEILDAM